jgi:tryptophan 2,3-dioxygenase
MTSASTEMLESDTRRAGTESPELRATIVGYYDDEGLTDPTEGLGEWRSRPMMTVRRTIGTKPGTSGSGRAAGLITKLHQSAFPDLWAARTAL